MRKVVSWLLTFGLIIGMLTLPVPAIGTDASGTAAGVGAAGEEETAKSESVAALSGEVTTLESLTFNNGVFSDNTPWVSGEATEWKNTAELIKAGLWTSQVTFLPPEIASWDDPTYLTGGMAYSVSVVRGLQSGDIVKKKYDQYWTDDYQGGSYEWFNGGTFWILIADYTHNPGTNRIYDWLHYIYQESDGSYTLVTGQGVYYLVDGYEVADLPGYGFKTTEDLEVIRGGTLINEKTSSRGYKYSTDGVAGGTVIGTKSYENYQNIDGEVEPLWAKYAGNPVVTGSYVFDPCVIKDGSTYKMWYTHVDGTNWRIYYAYSSNGTSWTVYGEVLAPSGDETRVAGPAVILDGGTYKMWYSSRGATTWTRIKYATSNDGINWTVQSTALETGAPGSWDSQMVREPWVIKDGSTYKMWYSGTAAWPVFKIGYATSSDGVTWTKHTSNPIFTGTPGGWDAFQVYAPSVVVDSSGGYHMFFSGTDSNMSQRWSTGHATSSDGISWAEDALNPILIPDGMDDSADYVSALDDGGVWKLWYSYGGNYAIGLATLDWTTLLYLEPAVASIPNDNSTTQTFTVRIANALDLYGYQFVITFNKDNLECTAAAFDGTFFPTDPSKSSAPSGWNATIDNANGKVYFARTLLYPELPLSGSGPLATVTFRSKSGASAGSYKIDFEQNKLGDVEGNELDHTKRYAWLTLYGVGNLSGSVDLQGRANESGGTVTIMSASGYLESKTITAADGSWSFTNIPAGDYQVNIEMARYLDAQKGEYGGGVTVPPGGTVVLSKVKLLGGDANDDDEVDISDGTIIGGQFGLSPPTDSRADINNDDMVDILDLVLFGGNYTKTSPVPWS